MKTMSEEEAIAAGLYEVIGKEIDDTYIAQLKKLRWCIRMPSMQDAERI